MFVFSQSFHFLFTQKKFLYTILFLFRLNKHSQIAAEFSQLIFSFRFFLPQIFSALLIVILLFFFFARDISFQLAYDLIVLLSMKKRKMYGFARVHSFMQNGKLRRWNGHMFVGWYDCARVSYLFELIKLCVRKSEVLTSLALMHLYGYWY